MYKLFLCFRYLRRRFAAWAAVIAVALCVFMLVVSISVMDGFVSKIEVAAKGLYGDVVVDGKSLDGLPYYDELIAEIKRQLPDKVEDASPFILTYGLLEAPFFSANSRQTVQIAGIRLPEHTRISAFGQGLTYQGDIDQPTFDPPLEHLLENIRRQIHQTDRLARDVARDKGLYDRLENAWKQLPPPQRDRFEDAWGSLSPEQNDRLGTVWRKQPPEQRDRLEGRSAIVIYALFSYLGSPDPNVTIPLRNLYTAAFQQRDMEEILVRAKPYQAQMAELERQINQAIADGTADEPAEGDASGNDDGLTVKTKEDALREQLNRLTEMAGSDRYAGDVSFPFQPPGRRAIVGLGLPGFIFRTEDGTVVRMAGPGNDIVLTLIPFGEKSLTGNLLVRDVFTIIDESRTDVSTVDANTVYLPFETLQKINKMGPQIDDETGRIARPARTSQIHVKVRPAFAQARERANSRLAVRLGMEPRLRDALDEVAADIQRIGMELRNDPRYAAGFAGTELRASSWRERQRFLVGQIQSQRTLVVIMFAVISSVAVVLIFVIFYMIVLQKTKDIGVIKSLGGSSMGVASIFLGYGGATGLIGAVLGILGGWQFVKHINAIHDWVGRTYGFHVWNREWFMFDEIPAQVDASSLLSIAVGAIIAGLLGSLIPAIIASHMQPVRALRYE
ncbi:MAG: FtsX-like permease family protein [Phycisphaerae bacterium]|nr:FtsX-like permease family protein [Phycisphaerae bacterium]